MKVLLDTSYLMPLFRMEPDIKFDMDDFELILDNCTQLLLLSISFIELKWLVIKKGRNDPALLDRLEIAFSEALRYIENNEDILIINNSEDRINDISYELEKFGHTDYFDNVILASSMLHADILVSEDDSLIKLVSKQKSYNSIFFNPKFQIMNWKKFKGFLIEKNNDEDKSS
ncbi:MAG: hypothetical protein INQ03_00905 [Candidatus Heimdallarchaeota archaeon]|nr:hypothetical protein [Candidatus Heimdallarchaeota archaeon]